LQKGSKDNITVIVVDLKAQRKFKSKSWLFNELNLGVWIYKSWIQSNIVWLSNFSSGHIDWAPCTKWWIPLSLEL
jgi:hypothetical protein